MCIYDSTMLQIYIYIHTMLQIYIYIGMYIHVNPWNPGKPNNTQGLGRLLTMDCTSSTLVWKPIHFSRSCTFRFCSSPDERMARRGQNLTRHIPWHTIHAYLLYIYTLQKNACPAEKIKLNCRSKRISMRGHDHMAAWQIPMFLVRCIRISP